MNKQSSGIVADGLRRLLRSPAYRQKQAAMEAEIRAKYAAELSAATDSRQRAAIKEKIRQEIKRSKPSPYSLWSKA
jgi:hypothetical protein